MAEKLDNITLDLTKMEELVSVLKKNNYRAVRFTPSGKIFYQDTNGNWFDALGYAA